MFDYDKCYYDYYYITISNIYYSGPTIIYSTISNIYYSGPTIVQLLYTISNDK